MTPGRSQPTSTKTRRRKVFVRPDLQLKVVFITMFVASVSLIINSQLVVSGLRQVSEVLESDQSIAQVMKLLEVATMRTLSFSIVIAVPLAAIIGITYSFRFAGPVVGIQDFLRELRDGRWDSQCQLREKDDLHDIAELVNECIAPMRARIRTDQDTLRQVEQLLTSAVFEADEDSRQAVTAILGRIQIARAEVGERLPDDQPELLITDPVAAPRQRVADDAPANTPDETPEHMDIEA